MSTPEEVAREILASVVLAAHSPSDAVVQQAALVSAIAAAIRAATADALAERDRLAKEVERLREALVLIVDRAKSSGRDRWIDDSAAIHSIAFTTLRGELQQDDPL